MPGYGLDDNTLKMVAATVYGENRGQNDNAIINTASSIFNRIGKNEWANLDVPSILQRGFYAVRDSTTGKNNGYAQAMTNRFPDKDSENEFKQIYAKVAALNRGTIDPTDAQFYFNQKEINRLVKSKSFDFSKVEEGAPFMAGKIKFRTFHYK